MSPGQDQRYEGRLELTWTNKDQRLLAAEDGSYEWLPPADYRIAEVRLLDHAALVGDTRQERSRARAKDNLLIRGDALNALTSLTGLPEFAREYEGRVKLAYLDPPFNTQQAFQHYDDALEHSVWLTMMRDRLVQIKRLLAPDGSVWVHCDDSEGAHMRVLMDEVFGAKCFVATVIWQTRTSRENRKAIGELITSSMSMRRRDRRHGAKSAIASSATRMIFKTMVTHAVLGPPSRSPLKVSGKTRCTRLLRRRVWCMSLQRVGVGARPRSSIEGCSPTIGSTSRKMEMESRE